jgi:hypothetical protein
MPWGAAIGAAGAIGGGMLSAGGAKDAAKAQLRATRENIDFQRWLFERQTALQAPFREGGLSGQNAYMTLLGLRSPTSDNTSDPNFGKYAGAFDMEHFQQDPGYAFRLSEGLKALDRQAAARGGLISGNALKAATQYGQEMGSQEYMNAYNRYYNDKAQALNPYAALMGIGQQATNQVQNAGSQMGQAVGNAYSDLGNARASSYAGQANAWSNALSGVANVGMNYYMMNKMFPSNSADQLQTVDMSYLHHQPGT